MMTSTVSIEQDVLDAHNRLRSDPNHFVALIGDDLKHFEGDQPGCVIRKSQGATGLIIQEGKACYLEALEALKNMNAGELPGFR